MINRQLINPKSIAVVGASENTQKPGGKVLVNLLENKYKGIIYAVNPNILNIKGTISVTDINKLPQVDLAIISIRSDYCLKTVKLLLENGTRTFIIYSAGFKEAGSIGENLENELSNLIKQYNACLIGPNCIGVITEFYKGVFTSPIPDYDSQGCELISSSGATAVFIMEAAASTGLRFSNLFSIGNAAHTGVEELLEYMDNSFDENKSSKVKLLYLENIKNPFKFLKHATSLIKKGCKIAAIKSGHSLAGSRAATSHTGAMATSDILIRALFKKAGIVYCSGREELITTACVFQSKPLSGQNIAIITHAGGSAVMLTDILTEGGLNVPLIDENKAAKLHSVLNPGSSVQNPIDFLATGNADQLSQIIDFCESYSDIDAMIVVFGSSGLFNVRDVYQVIDKKMKECRKPIYPVLPSLINAKTEIEEFLLKKHVNFPDEVVLGKALPTIYFNPKPTFGMTHLAEMETATIRSIISQSENGYLGSAQTTTLLNAAGITTTKDFICHTIDELEFALTKINYPIVLKVVGPIHKSDIGGVELNINNTEYAIKTFQKMIKLKSVSAVQVQEMIKGEELYCGAVKQGSFGHLILCGLGGIFVEILKDVAYGLAPLTKDEAYNMVKTLKGYKIITGYRNRTGANEDKFIDAIVRIASLVHLAPEIAELDINPFKGNLNNLIAIDARIRIEK